VRSSDIDKRKSNKNKYKYINYFFLSLFHYWVQWAQRWWARLLCVGGGCVMGVVVFVGGWCVREWVAVVVRLREVLRWWSWWQGVRCIH
jgi:hypothetical protein